MGKGRDIVPPLTRIEVIGKRGREELMKWLKDVEGRRKKEKGHRGRTLCYAMIAHTILEKTATYLL